MTPWRNDGRSRRAKRRLRLQRLPRKQADAAHNPAYIFTEPRVGYRMVAGETRDSA